MKTQIASAMLAILFGASFNPSLAQGTVTIKDKDINVVHFQELRYPQLARTAHIQGVVVIKVRINDQGIVMDASAISGADALVQDCLKNAKNWRFQPNDQHAAVIVYRFRLPPSDCGSVSSFFMLQGANFATITACPLTIETQAK